MTKCTQMANQSKMTKTYKKNRGFFFGDAIYILLNKDKAKIQNFLEMGRNSIFRLIASAFFLIFLFLLFLFFCFSFFPLYISFLFFVFLCSSFHFFFSFLFLSFCHSFSLAFFLVLFLNSLSIFPIFLFFFLLLLLTKFLVVNFFLFYSKILLDCLFSFVRELFSVSESPFHAYCFYVTKFDLFHKLNLLLKEN